MTRKTRRLKDPELPPEQWWELAKTLPVEAMASPLFDLMTLEAPERWTELVRQNVILGCSWITRYLSKFPQKKAVLLGLECVERVLPIAATYRLSRMDHRLDDVLLALRQWAEEKQPKFSPSAILAQVAEVKNEVRCLESQGKTISMMIVMRVSASCENLIEAVDANKTGYSVRNALGCACGVIRLGRGLVAETQERLWQWNRILRDYESTSRIDLST